MNKARCLVISVIGFCLTGCGALPPLGKKPKSETRVLYAASGYLCTAQNAEKNNRQNTAWATDKKSAKAYALSRCQSLGRHPRCTISECIYTGSKTKVSSSRWYTCYVNNRARRGVWSATAHNRLTAVKRGFDRCRLYSDDPSSCFVSYCRLW